MSVEVKELKVKRSKGWEEAAATREAAEERWEILRRASAGCTMMLRTEVIARCAGDSGRMRGRQINMRGEWRMKNWDGEGGKTGGKRGGGKLLCDKDYWNKNQGKKERNSGERNGRCTGKSGFGVRLI